MRGANGADDEVGHVDGEGIGEEGRRRVVYAGDGARGVEVEEELVELGSDEVSCLRADDEDEDEDGAGLGLGLPMIGAVSWNHEARPSGFARFWSRSRWMSRKVCMPLESMAEER